MPSPEGNLEPAHMEIDNYHLPELLLPIQQHPDNEQGSTYNLQHQVNMVLTDIGSSIDADPGWANWTHNYQEELPDLHQLWARFFSPLGSSQQKKKTRILPLQVDTEARRSPRIRTRNNGFKHKGCPSRNCLACAAMPPTLSNKVMVKVGTNFCKMNVDNVSEDSLKGRSQEQQPIGSRRSSRKVISSKSQKGKEKIFDSGVSGKVVMLTIDELFV